jgi:hypothetical protein
MSRRQQHDFQRFRIPGLSWFEPRNQLRPDVVVPFPARDVPKDVDFPRFIGLLGIERPDLAKHF